MGTKLNKWQDKTIVSKFVKRGEHKENMREYGAIFEGTKDLPRETLEIRSVTSPAKIDCFARYPDIEKPNNYSLYDLNLSIVQMISMRTRK